MPRNEHEGQKVAKNRGILIRKTPNSDYLIYNPDNDSLFRVNQLGYDIYKLCNSGNDSKSIARTIAKKHQIKTDQGAIVREVQSFLIGLEAGGIVHRIRA